MASWVGMEARASAPAYYGGNALTIIPAPDAAATSAEILVRDSSGIEVDRFALTNFTSPVDWSGTTADGIDLPSGQYSFETVSYLNGEVSHQTPAEVYGRVIEVQSGANGAILVMQGGATVEATEVTALREP